MRILRRGGYPSRTPPLKSPGVAQVKPRHVARAPVTLGGVTEGNTGDVGSVATVDQPAGRGLRRAGSLSLALVLVLGWAVWAALTWQSQVRYVTEQDFRSDAADGHVTAYAIVTNIRPTRTWPPAAGPDAFDLPSLDASGNIDRIPAGGAPALMYFTDHAVGPTRVVDPDRFSSYTEMYAQELRAAGVPTTRGSNVPVAEPDDGHQVLGILLGTGALGAVLFAPRRGRPTRPFWFWVLGIPGGLGVLAYAVCVPLRNGLGVPVVTEPDDRPRDWFRWRGLHGFLLAVLVNAVLVTVVGRNGTHLDGVLFPHW